MGQQSSIFAVIMIISILINATKPNFNLKQYWCRVKLLLSIAWHYCLPLLYMDTNILYLVHKYKKYESEGVRFGADKLITFFSNWFAVLLFVYYEAC